MYRFAAALPFTSRDLRLEDRRRRVFGAALDRLRRRVVLLAVFLRRRRTALATFRPHPLTDRAVACCVGVI